jgi:hypothetical protein
MNPMKRNAVDRKLMTKVHRVEYDCTRKRGRIFMAPSCCADMEGAIDLFATIDPEVQWIETFAGDVQDTTYHRTSRNSWQSYHEGYAGPVYEPGR